MRLISYDCEVFAYDWLVTLKDKETGVFTRIWNDNEALKMALSDDCIYIGFNSKHYDQYIIKAIAADLSPQEIKQVNDFIIAGGQGWQCPLLNGICWSYRKCNETLSTWSMSSYQLQTSPCMNEESSGVLQANRFKTES